MGSVPSWRCLESDNFEVLEEGGRSRNDNYDSQEVGDVTWQMQNWLQQILTEHLLYTEHWAGEGDGNMGTISLGPGLGACLLTGVSQGMYSNMMDGRKWWEVAWESVCDSTEKAYAVGADERESFLEKMTFEQSSGRTFVNWEETVTWKGDSVRAWKGGLICSHLKYQPSL